MCVVEYFRNIALSVFNNILLLAMHICIGIANAQNRILALVVGFVWQCTARRVFH